MPVMQNVHLLNCCFTIDNDLRIKSLCSNITLTTFVQFLTFCVNECILWPLWLLQKWEWGFFKVLRRIKYKGRMAWENNWVITNQWDINAPLGFSDCLASYFFINCYESGHPISPGDVMLIKAKPLWAPPTPQNGQKIGPGLFENTFNVS